MLFYLFTAYCINKRIEQKIHFHNLLIYKEYKINQSIYYKCKKNKFLNYPIFST